LKRRELKKIEQLKNENVWKILKSSQEAAASAAAREMGRRKERIFRSEVKSHKGKTKEKKGMKALKKFCIMTSN